jgi:hypothetical protein
MNCCVHAAARSTVQNSSTGWRPQPTCVTSARRDLRSGNYIWSATHWELALHLSSPATLQKWMIALPPVPVPVYASEHGKLSSSCASSVWALPRPVWGAGAYCVLRTAQQSWMSSSRGCVRQRRVHSCWRCLHGTMACYMHHMIIPIRDACRGRGMLAFHQLAHPGCPPLRPLPSLPLRRPLSPPSSPSLCTARKPWPACAGTSQPPSMELLSLSSTDTTSFPASPCAKFTA